MNSNLTHNILNVLTLVVAILGMPEFTSIIPDAYALPLIGAMQGLKLIINVVRDGITGLAKQQPPVQ